MSAFDGYVQAAYHGGTMAGGPTFTVLHDAETPLTVGYCDSIVEFFRKGPAAGTSAHAMVDPSKAIKMLPDNVVAYAAGPYANTWGWHLEQAGYASFTRAQWTTPDGMAQLNRVGACLREIHTQWHIPIRWMTDDQLRAAAKGDRSQGGMTTHQQIARVLGGTTHTDPEDNYPRDLLLAVVLGSAAPTPHADLGDSDMKLIQSEGRGIAAVGPGYFKSVTAEELPVAVACFGQPYVGNDRQFDLARSVAFNGVTVSSTAVELSAAVASLSGLPAADVDEDALAAALAPKLSGVSKADVADALRQVLREGTGS